MSSRVGLMSHIRWPRSDICCCEVMAHVVSPPAASRPNLAGVAELVDALDLGSSDESCGGSSPSARPPAPHGMAIPETALEAVLQLAAAGRPFRLRNGKACRDILPRF